MSNISSVGRGNVSPNSIQQSNAAMRYGQADRTDEAAAGRRGTDRVDLSEHAGFMNKIRDLPPVREDKIAAAKAALEDPDYISDDRLDTALDRMIDELSLIDELG